MPDKGGLLSALYSSTWVEPRTTKNIEKEYLESFDCSSGEECERLPREGR